MTNPNFCGKHKTRAQELQPRTFEKQPQIFFRVIDNNRNLIFGSRMPSRKSFLFKIYALLRYRKAAVLNRSRAAESVATDHCMKL